MMCRKCKKYSQRIPDQKQVLKATSLLWFLTKSEHADDCEVQASVEKHTLTTHCETFNVFEHLMLVHIKMIQRFDQFFSNYLLKAPVVKY